MSFKVGDYVIREYLYADSLWKMQFSKDEWYTPKKVLSVCDKLLKVEGSDDDEWLCVNFILHSRPEPETTTITLVEEYKQTLIQIEQLQSKAKTLLEEINKASK